MRLEWKYFNIIFLEKELWLQYSGGKPWGNHRSNNHMNNFRYRSNNLNDKENIPQRSCKSKGDTLGDTRGLWNKLITGRENGNLIIPGYLVEL